MLQHMLPEHVAEEVRDRADKLHTTQLVMYYIEGGKMLVTTVATYLKLLSPTLFPTAGMSQDAPLYTYKADLPATAPAALNDVLLPETQRSQHGRRERDTRGLGQPAQTC